MKVLLLNGSPHPNGCTFTALSEVAATLQSAGIETEILHLGNQPVQDCVACCACRKNPGKCAFDDDIVNRIIEKAADADAFVFGSPVYFSHPTGRILSILDRVFYAGKSAFAHKPAAAITSARRAGTSATLDVMNKYFTYSQMLIVSSTYWNMVHGSTPEEVLQDAEGLQTMRNLATNMIWLLRCMEAGRSVGIEPPQAEISARTSFIR